MYYFLNIHLWMFFITSSFSTSLCMTKLLGPQKAVSNVSMSSLLNRRLLEASSSLDFNVDNYGAKGDGNDDSEAFKETWEDACSTSNKSIIIIPKNRVYHLKPITFSGPCNSPLTMKVYGTIKATIRLSDYENDTRHWIAFEDLNDFTVEGGGVINGNGRKWWQRSCKVNKTMPCKTAPTAVTFDHCKNLRVTDLIIQNAQQMHISFQKCLNVVVSNLVVSAPARSPNTDGIHVTATQNILINNSVIRTGDDCISIVSGSKNAEVTNIICGPGHGISIGSLGEGGSTDYVSNVLVSKARILGASNGVRIKTWQGGSGSATNIIFQDIKMHNVTNPIIIDQNYCDQKEPCPDQASAVQVSNVMYKNIKGTSASEIAIRLDCSKNVPCTGILLQEVNLTRESGEYVKASLANVEYTTLGEVSL